MTIENKLIAEFMGYEFIDGEFRVPHSDKTTNSNFSEWCSTYGDIDGMFSVGYLLAPSNLMFHSDWNWLIEVVEKIESLDYSIDITASNVYINHSDDEFKQIVGFSDTYSKIEAVYNACLDFIKWYNEQNK